MCRGGCCASPLRFGARRPTSTHSAGERACEEQEASGILRWAPGGGEEILLMFLLAERSRGVVVIPTPYKGKENPPSCFHPDMSSRRLSPAKSRTPGYLCTTYRALSFQRLGRRKFSCKLPFCGREMKPWVKVKWQAGACTSHSVLTQLCSPPTAVALLSWGGFDRVVCQCQQAGESSCVALG